MPTLLLRGLLRGKALGTFGVLAMVDEGDIGRLTCGVHVAEVLGDVVIIEEHGENLTDIRPTRIVQYCNNIYQ